MDTTTIYSESETVSNKKNNFFLQNLLICWETFITNATLFRVTCESFVPIIYQYKYKVVLNL